MAHSEAAATLSDSRKSLWIPAALCFVLLIIESYYLFYRFDGALRLPGPSQGKSIAQILTSRGSVRQKSDGTLIWQLPSNGQPLFRQDAIATMEDGQTVVVFEDHSELSIEPNSLVILEGISAEPDRSKAQDQPHGQKITVRLVRGSIKRNSKGPASILVRLSGSKDQNPVIIDDHGGNAIFRIVRRGYGLEVVVESGTITLNQTHKLRETQSATVNNGKIKLPPPSLKEPQIEIRPKGKSGLLERILDVLWFPSAKADPNPPSNPTSVQIRFRWDTVPESTKYVVQISKDQSFSTILLEKQIEENEFLFEPEVAPEAVTEQREFFFRAAAIASDGSYGEFSQPQRVEIFSTPEPVFSPKPVATPEPVRPAPPAILATESTPRAATKPTPSKTAPKVSKEVDTFVRTHPSLRGELAYGFQLHHRHFHQDKNPKDSQGGGFVPARIRGELDLIRSDGWVIGAGGTYLFETITPDLPAPYNKKTGASLVQGWATAGTQIHSLFFGAGPYLSSAVTVKPEGLSVSADTQLLGGLLTRFSPHPDSLERIHWKGQIALVALGARGVDVMMSVRQPIRRLMPRRWSEVRGLLAGIELQGRLMTLETAYSGVFELGFVF